MAVGRVRDQDQTEPALALFSFGIKQLPDISVAPGLRLPLRPVDIVSLSSLSLKAPGPSSSSVSPYPSNKGVWEKPLLWRILPPFRSSPPVRGRAAGGGDRLRELPG